MLSEAKIIAKIKKNLSDLSAKSCICSPTNFDQVLWILLCSCWNVFLGFQANSLWFLLSWYLTWNLYLNGCNLRKHPKDHTYYICLLCEIQRNPNLKERQKPKSNCHNTDKSQHSDIFTTCNPTKLQQRAIQVDPGYFGEFVLVLWTVQQVKALRNAASFIMYLEYS